MKKQEQYLPDTHSYLDLLHHKWTKNMSRSGCVDSLPQYILQYLTILYVDNEGLGQVALKQVVLLDPFLHD